MKRLGQLGKLRGYLVLGGMVVPIAKAGDFCSSSYEPAVVVTESLRYQLCLPTFFKSPFSLSMKCIVRNLGQHEFKLYLVRF